MGTGGRKSAKSRFFKITQREDKSVVELSYYEKQNSKTPKKEKEPLIIRPGPQAVCGVYYREIGDDQLHLWSGSLAEFRNFTTLTEIALEAQRLGDAGWIQHLKFNPSDDGRSSTQVRNNWISNLRQALDRRGMPTQVKEIADQRTWQAARARANSYNAIRGGMKDSLP